MVSAPRASSACSRVAACASRRAARSARAAVAAIYPSVAAVAAAGPAARAALGAAVAVDAARGAAGAADRGLINSYALRPAPPGLPPFAPLTATIVTNGTSCEAYVSASLVQVPTMVTTLIW